MTREQKLIDALYHITASTTLNEALARAQDALDSLIKEGADVTQYGVAYAAHVKISSDYAGAIESAKKHCLHDPGKNYCVVAVHNIFVGKVNVEELI